MSRQREWQIEMRKQGRCVKCGQPAAKSRRKGQKGKSAYCTTHLVAQREQNRKGKDPVRRNWNCTSYALEDENESE